MGFGERDDMSARRNHEMSAVLRASHLPLVRSALQSVTSAYSEAKSRYPLLGLVGGVAEVGVRNASMVALSRAAPLTQTLGPQIEMANSFALVGLDQLERTFPILNQSTDEVVGHLKDAFFLTLDDMQLWLADGMDRALDRVERLSHGAWTVVRQLQDSQVGRAASWGLDDVLGRLENASAYYMPLPPTLRREWEMRVQEYEDEDDDDEPGAWTRVRALLLSISLQLYHRMAKVREQLEDAAGTLGDAVQAVGLGAVLDLLGQLLQSLQRLLVALVYRAESLRELSLGRLRAGALALAELRPVRQTRELPLQVRRLLGDLRELSKILVQLVINATPLYTMLRQPSDKEVEDFLNQEDVRPDGSANSLFLKAMDGRPRRRKSLFSRAARSPGSPDTAPPGRRSSLKQDSEGDGPPAPPDGAAQRRPSAAELILTPLKELVSQSQKAFEYLNPNSVNSAAD
ncbi:perilipin 6 isoform X2 [Syngnathoides biaculeatus]|uniref:perilipin 6 isoform X2 n=2 Tax=Syngnathoides biaculeatus TaxID=300417 RepID=UPI002ADE52C3|nr:perilipin 6 isoform X2 [Syngnathoides biaculeatus]XP_061699658.1 perilipin 6 isoform X2 [Syngnathoides biaculeatus]XP_061699659.1 perilipin 6 isoform X2 [Syngnathoides biaculeatus]